MSVRIAPDLRLSVNPRSVRSLRTARYSQILLFDVVESGMIGVQYFACKLRIEPLVGTFRPWHGEKPVEIGSNHRCFRVRLSHFLQASRVRVRPAVEPSPAFERRRSSFDILRQPNLRFHRVPCESHPSDGAASIPAAASECRTPLHPECAGARAAPRAVPAGIAAPASVRSTTLSVSSSSIFCSKFRSGE